MGVLPLAIRASSHFFGVAALHTHRLPQAERLVADDGEESTRHPTMAGRIFKIVATKSCREYVIMEVFNVSGSRDGRYGMPTMCASPDHGYHIIPPSVSYESLWPCLPLIAFHQNISFIFNAQHDCEGGECGYTISDAGAHDGQATAKVERKMIHSAHDRFFINLHALHNAWRLREVLPRKLTEPVPYVVDRQEFHHKMARKLQKSNPKKRAKAKERAKDTREQKKRAIESVEDGPEGEQSGDEPHLAV